MKDYGLLLRNRREALGMTQETAAEAVGVSVDTWYAYESNQRLPPMETVRRICAALDEPYLEWAFQEAHAGPGNVLPPAKAMCLSEAGATLFARFVRFMESQRALRLLEISADGDVDEEERPDYEAICQEMDELIAAELAWKLAKKSDRPDGSTSRRSGFRRGVRNNSEDILPQRRAGVKEIQQGGAAL